MNYLLIIGARGFGREVYELAIDSIGHGISFVIKGFLDDNPNALDKYDNYPPILTSVQNYIPEKNDVFICALGESKFREKYTLMIKSKMGKFTTLVHKTAILNPSSKVGTGSIIGQYVIISSNAIVGEHVSIHGFSAIGHDSVIGDYCSLGAYSFLGGYSKLGNFVTLHPKASVMPHKIVGERSIVGSNSVVMRNIKSNITVHGNPAKVIYSENDFI